jgi:fructoselysine-6-P-deglycase FrlB-like protein
VTDATDPTRPNDLPPHLPPDRPALFRADVLAGPATLAALLDAAAAPGGWFAPLDAAAPALDRVRRVAITGMGSSRFAALSAAPFLRERGLPTDVELASTSRPIGPAADLLVVVISSSGGTPEAVAAARRHRGRSALVVALTNRPDSPLAGAADVVLPLLAGEETAGIACRTYAATVAALLLVAGWVAAFAPEEVRSATPASSRLDPDDLRRALPVMRELLDGGDAWLPWAVDLIDGAPAIHVLGGGGRFGSVEQAALMLREAPRLPAVAFDAGDWLHVGLYTALPGLRAILFAGTPYDAELAETIRGRGGELLAIGHRVEGAALSLEYPGADDPVSAALVETTLVELLAAELWDRATAEDPGDAA